MQPSADQPIRRVILLGSTGSIGRSTLDVISHLHDSGARRFEVVGIAAGARATLACEQARRFNVSHVAIADSEDHQCLRDLSARVYRGADCALELVESAARPGDVVVAAMVGSAGIPAILSAIERGCDIALANKETLVAAGAIVMPLAHAKGVRLLPVDSEHSAIFQALEGLEAWRSGGSARHGRSLLEASVARIVLTASGGPFRNWSAQRMALATVEEALSHPTWNMGPKVTIDSATLMNKALEIIEAHWLFDAPSPLIDVIVHPQSIVHGLVEFTDGSVVAQLSPPDMRTPIQYALTWPSRVDGVSRKIDWAALRSLEFEPVDCERFIAPAIAKRVIDSSPARATCGAILNAANEVAVQAFLDRRIAFGRIVEIVQEALEAIGAGPVRTMQDVLAADQAARVFVQDRIASQSIEAVGASR